MLAAFYNKNSMPWVKYFVTLLCIGNLVFVQGQTHETLVLAIRTEFKKINTNDSLKTIILNNEEFLEQMTDGGGTLTGYFEDDQLVKFTEWVGLSYGNVVSEYYFKDLELFFLYQKESKFADKIGGEPGDLDYAKLETMFEGRYYFDKNKRIKTLEKGQRSFSADFDLIKVLDHTGRTKKLFKRQLQQK